MKNRIIEHLAGIAFISLLLTALLVFIRVSNFGEKRYESRINELIATPISNSSDPFQQALFKDVMNIYYPGNEKANDSLIHKVLLIKQKQFNDKLMHSHTGEHLSWSSFFKILEMYLKFLFVYVTVMALTYYCVQTFAVWRFISSKQKSCFLVFNGKDNGWRKKLESIIKNIFKGLLYFALFSPSYVIAYSIRTEFNTDSVLFMILLGVVSNGLLITYANKFHAFLTAESRKGFIETALVKNLKHSYSYNDKDGIRFKLLFAPVKNFSGHVFNHIFMNARHQYLSTIKEQASFLITGLVIIEMALNIHGHLNYEMLRQILYKNYESVIVIILCIFYTVKLTEIFADLLVYRENMKYENRN